MHPQCIFQSLLDLYPEESKKVNVLCLCTFRKGRPYSPVFNAIVDGIFEGDFTQKWMSDMTLSNRENFEDNNFAHKNFEYFNNRTSRWNIYFVIL